MPCVIISTRAALLDKGGHHPKKLLYSKQKAPTRTHPSQLPIQRGRAFAESVVMTVALGYPLRADDKKPRRPVGKYRPSG